MNEIKIYIMNGKREYVKSTTPLAYTKDVNDAWNTSYDLSALDMDDALDDAESAVVLGAFKTVVANDGNPDQQWTIMLELDGTPYYRIDIVDSSKVLAAYNGSAKQTPVANTFSVSFRDIVYDSLLDVFGASMVKNTVQSALNKVANKLNGGGTTFSDVDDVDKLIDEIQQQTKAEIVKPKETLDDYVADDVLLEQLRQIVDFFDNRKKYTDNGIEIPKGVLFKGPPGTGKTYAARCIAGTVDCYFMACTASSLQGMYIGSGAANIKAVFKGARVLAEKSGKGVIMFMDELDSVSSRNTGSSAGDEVNRTINQLLAEMSGFTDDDNVMVMGATNYSELIDQALLRSGRFSRQITIDYPDDVQREQMLKHYSSKLKIKVKWDPDEATALTKTFTPADIKEVVNSAAIKAVRQGRSEVELSDLNESINEVITKDIRKPDDSKTLDLVTAHECGHVLAEVLLKGTLPTKVTNYAYGDAGGFTQPSEVLTGIVKNTDLINEIKMLLAGRAAEYIIMNYVTTGASNDLDKAKRILKNFYTKYNFDVYDVEKLDQLVVDKLGEYYDDVVVLLSQYEDTLRALISELSLKRVLYSSDIAGITANILIKKGVAK